MRTDRILVENLIIKMQNSWFSCSECPETLIFYRYRQNCLPVVTNQFENVYFAFENRTSISSRSMYVAATPTTQRRYEWTVIPSRRHSTCVNTWYRIAFTRWWCHMSKLAIFRRPLSAIPAASTRYRSSGYRQEMPPSPTKIFTCPFCALCHRITTKPTCGWRCWVTSATQR